MGMQAVRQIGLDHGRAERIDHAPKSNSAWEKERRENRVVATAR